MQSWEPKKDGFRCRFLLPCCKLKIMAQENRAIRRPGSSQRKDALPDAILEIHQEDGWLAKIGGVDFRKVAIRAKIDSGIIVPSPFQFSGLRGKE